MCSEFNILCGRGQGVHVATPLQEICIVWVGLNPEMTCGVGIGTGCMNLVTVISRYMWVSVT